MAGGPPSFREEIEASMADDMSLGGSRQGQEHLVMIEKTERGSRSVGSQRRQKSESKTSGSAAASHAWNGPPSRSRKVGFHVVREPLQGDFFLPEYVEGFRGTRSQRERPDTHLLAEIDLDSLYGLEMEVVRRQLQVLTGRLQEMEEQGHSWRQRETLLFTVLLSACVASLWLWVRN